jgi:murein DD-endopeptidase MepM/ murein hydrolase activator NlpD
VSFGPVIPGPWRLSELASQPDVKVAEGAMERRSLIDALTDSRVPRAQIYRIIGAFKGVHKFDKPRKKDTFAVALDLPSRRVRAFEYQAGPTEIYQARERDGGELVGERLDLHVEKRRIDTAIVIGDDLGKSLVSAGLDPSLRDILDDALEGRAQLSSLHPGARLRLVLEAETALGAFARYTDLSALEYLADDADAPPLRIYHFESKKSEGYFDARAHQPYKGGFRSPIPFARISSHFNLHRMHPILHVVRPHNGVDFSAPSGTPVYAAGPGSIEFAGDSGPSGNLVTIRHADGLTTGYAHLSRFAPRLKPGTSVDTRQLIGYVGSTGRSTGPHLHFSAKKNGVFIDPLRLKLDGERVLPRAERDVFDEKKAQLDKVLDAVPVPAPLDVPRAHTEASAGEPLEPADDEK